MGRRRATLGGGSQTCRRVPGGGNLVVVTLTHEGLSENLTRRKFVEKRRRASACVGRQTRELGQKSCNTQSSQRGRRAMHTRRPCRMSRRLNSPRSAAGIIGFNTYSILTASV